MNKIQKKLSVLLLSILMVTLLSGCVDASYHVTINMDGSGQYELKVLTNDLVLSQLDHFKQRLEQVGYQLQPLSEEGRKGWIAIKKVDNVTKNPPGKEFKQEASTALQLFTSSVASANSTEPQLVASPYINNLQRDFQVKNTFLTTTFIINTDADLTSLKRNSRKFGQFGQAILDQMNLNFILTLPIQPAEHNATTVSEDGKTLTWKMIPGEKNPIHLVVKIPNPIGWGIIIIILILILIILIIWFLKRKKRRKNRRDDDGPFSSGNGTHTPKANFSPNHPSDSELDRFHWD